MPDHTSTTTSASPSSTTTTRTSTRTAQDHVVEVVTTLQLDQLDSTDYYATAWADAVRNHLSQSKSTRTRFIQWGGKGRGGRESNRRTYQPKDVILDHVHLEYCSIIVGTATTGTMIKESSTAGAGAGAVVAATSTATQAATRNTVLLNDATLKLLNGGRVYAMIGSSGCGKSSLLRRIAANKIPGFPTHVTTLYIPQEMIVTVGQRRQRQQREQQREEQDGGGAKPLLDTNDATTEPNLPVPTTSINYIIQQYRKHMHQYQSSSRLELERLERAMEMLDVESEDDQNKLEQLATHISELEDELGISYDDAADDGADDDDIKNDEVRQIAQDSLRFMNVEECYWDQSIQSLSEGVQKRITLAVAYAVCRTVTIDLLLLDEPTSGLDVLGLIKLRQLISIITNEKDHDDTTGNNHRKKKNANNDNDNNNNNKSNSTTILLVSHDIDFINSVATDVVDWYDGKLYYYAGNYADYQQVRYQHDARQARQGAALEKKRSTMRETIRNLKKKGPSTRRQIESHKKRFEREARQEFTNNETNGIERRRYGIRTGDDPNATTDEPPDKAIQFVFKKVTSQWHEPLLTALDVGHTFDTVVRNGTTSLPDNAASAILPGVYVDEKNELVITKKDGYLFDCIDLCIEEGSVYCIVGENSSGKTTLLRLLSKQFGPPTEGKIMHANNVDVVYIDQEMIDSYLLDSINIENDTVVPVGTLTVLQYLTQKYPNRSNDEIRAELSSFGLSNQQHQQQVLTIPIQFLSGGERRRLCFADRMLSYQHAVHVLILDEPTCNLDPDSVNALLYGLKRWNGTIIVVSHDFHFIRMLQAKCYLLSAQEGKLRRIEGGIDAYLKSFSTTTSMSSTSFRL